MEIQQKKVSDLTNYENNSRTHSQEQINQICASITEFGFNNPILIDSNNQIIAGHGRLQAAKNLELETVPCVELSNLSDAQKKAYVIADNQIALNSGWDLDMLRFEVEALKELDFNLDLLGFDEDVLKKLLDIDCEFPELPDGDRDPFQQKTFTLHDEQASFIDDAIKKAKSDPRINTGLNDNSNGNAIAWICEKFLGGQDD
jgi:ParB-like chromosome segregation protein Spo0J